MNLRLFLIAFYLFIFSSLGEVLSDFSLPIYKQGKEFTLSKELTKHDKVLINFWASWCTSCVTELPELEALKSDPKNKNVLFVAINAGDSKKKIKKFLKKYKFSYLILEDRDRSLSKSVGVLNLPQTIVVDQKRTILFKGNRPPTKL